MTPTERAKWDAWEAKSDASRLDGNKAHRAAMVRAVVAQQFAVLAFARMATDPSHLDDDGGMLEPTWCVEDAEDEREAAAHFPTADDFVATILGEP